MQGVGVGQQVPGRQNRWGQSEEMNKLGWLGVEWEDMEGEEGYEGSSPEDRPGLEL